MVKFSIYLSRRVFVMLQTVSWDICLKKNNKKTTTKSTLLVDKEYRKKIVICRIQPENNKCVWNLTLTRNNYNWILGKRQECRLQLTLSTLDDIFSRRHFEIFLFSPENRLWHFMQIVPYGDNVYNMSKPIFWESRKNMMKLSSAEFAQRDVKVKETDKALRVYECYLWILHKNKKSKVNVFKINFLEIIKKTCLYDWKCFRQYALL